MEARHEAAAQHCPGRRRANTSFQCKPRHQGANVSHPGHSATSQQAKKLWAMRDAEIRRPRGADFALENADTDSTSATTISSSNGGEGRVKVKNLETGGFLDSSSYDSRDNDPNMHSNATRVLRRLKLIESDDDDDEKSAATTKVSNFAFQKRIQTAPASGRYYRPVDSLEKNGVCSPPSPPASKKSARSAASIGRPKRSVGNMSGRSDLPVAIDTLPSGLSSLSFNSSDYDSKIEAASDSDDDMRQMESVTHTFQLNLVADGASEKMRSKQGPLSGIGVDVRNEYSEQDRVETPREATNVTCTISSIVGEILGHPKNGSGGTPKRTSLSPFDIVKNMICSPDRVPGRTKKADHRRKGKQDCDDDVWSADVDFRSEYGDGDSSASCARSEAISGFSESSVGRTHQYGNMGDAGGTKTLQEKYDKSLSYRQFHREDLSYYGTEITSLYQPSYSDDDQSVDMSQTEPFRRRAKFRDSPFVRRR